MTKAADRIGAGSFGNLGRTPRSERGRAKAQAEGLIPEYDLQRFDLTKVAPCPMNPRRNYGTDEQQVTLGSSLANKQVTACVAVTRAAYLKLWPTHDRLLGPEAEHVLLNGERRYRSARRVGLEALDFVVRDDLASSQADFLDYLLLENEDREDFDIIERSRGLKQLLDACDGNAAEVARRRNRDRSWVGTQISLLSLPAEIQELLAGGQMAERYGRRLARAFKDDRSLSVADLIELEGKLKEEERSKREAEKALLEAAKTQMLSADNTALPSHGHPSQSAAVLSADNTARVIATSPGTTKPMSPAVLSADNIATPAEPAAPANPATPQTPGQRGAATPEMLSADNTAAPELTAPLPHQAPAATPHHTASALVQALGATAQEQAATLRRGLADDSFAALLEALHALV